MSHTTNTPAPQSIIRRATLAVLLLALVAAGAQAATLTVCASGCGFSSIQTAIQAASNGDTLELAPATYFEGDILIDRDLTITTSSGQANIEGGSAQAVFRIDAQAMVTIENVWMTDATRALVINRGIVTLRRAYLIGAGNVSTYGGIVNRASGYLKLEGNSVVANNRSGNLGGGINNFGLLEVSNTTITGNRGRLGGGLLNLQGDAVIGASSISFNHATVRGGGYANAHVGGGSVIILPSSSYSGNTADAACDRYYDIHRTPACVN